MHKPCAQVFSEYRELVAIGLDVPQITRVASALAENGIDIGRDVYTVNWAAEKLGEYIASGKTPPESEEKSETDGLTEDEPDTEEKSEDGTDH